MPRYFFNVRAAARTIRDPDGTDLADQAAAREHARIVAGELMRNREEFTRSWQLDVRDDTGRRCFDLLFANVDESLRDLPTEMRSAIQDLRGQSASLFEEIRATRLRKSMRKWMDPRVKLAGDGRWMGKRHSVPSAEPRFCGPNLRKINALAYDDHPLFRGESIIGGTFAVADRFKPSDARDFACLAVLITFRLHLDRLRKRIHGTDRAIKTSRTCIDESWRTIQEIGRTQRQQTSH
jgi:hypothetical protein